MYLQKNKIDNQPAVNDKTSGTASTKESPTTTAITTPIQTVDATVATIDRPTRSSSSFSQPMPVLNSKTVEFKEKDASRKLRVRDIKSPSTSSFFRPKKLFGATGNLFLFHLFIDLL